MTMVHHQTTNTASERQIQFINSLKDNRDVSGKDGQRTLAIARELWKIGRFGHEAASKTIDALMELPKLQRQPRATTDVPEGMHKVGDRIFKVQVAVHGSGHKYAKELTWDQCPTNGFDHEVEPGLMAGECEECHRTGVHNIRFEYARGVMHLLSADTKMTKEDAQAFGALYGTCCRCGRTLTDEDSIELGIGPVCARKEGWA